MAQIGRPRARVVRAGEAGDDEPLGIHRHAFLEPPGVGISADEQEEMAHRAGVGGSAAPVTEHRSGEAVPVALQCHDLLADVQVTFGSAWMRSIR